jgi:hypothetical protein
MLIIAGHTELDPDDGDGAVAVMRDLVTRACDAPGCLDVAITIDSADPTGTVLTGRRTAEQVDHWNGDYHGVPGYASTERNGGCGTYKEEVAGSNPASPTSKSSIFAGETCRLLAGARGT